MSAADADTVIRVDESAFFQDSSEVDPKDFLDHFDWDRTFAAVPAESGDPADAIGVYTAYPLSVTVPGPGNELRVVPFEGLSWVGVHPDSRRQGVLRAMMRHHMDHMRERGVALGGLHAAEVGIYGRFGYGTSSLDVWVEMGRGTTLTAPGLEEAAAKVVTRYRPQVGAEADVQAVHAAATAATLGAVTRNEAMSLAWLRDYPAMRRGREPGQVMFAEVDGQRTGIARFSRKSGWEDGQPKGEVNVHELSASDPATMLALARRMLDFDLTSKVTFHDRRLDDPLIWWTGGVRQVTLKVADALWLRLVDLPAALMARGYAASCDVVLEVVDDFCPWNAGTWRVAVDADGVAAVTRTDAAAQVRLPVQALAEAYLGGRSLVSVGQTGALSVGDKGALYAVSRAFRADVEPAAAFMF